MKIRLLILFFTLNVLIFSFKTSIQAQQPNMGVSGAVYGNAIRNDTLSNWPIGTQFNYVVSIRFKAIRSGSINAVRWYNIYTAGDSGYSRGNGGTIRVDIKADSGAPSYTPTGASLATATMTSAKSQFFPKLTLSNTVALTAGQRYHITFTNIHADPTNNYVSVDVMYPAYNYDGPTGDPGGTWTNVGKPSPLQANIPNEDAGTLYLWAGNWTDVVETPIYEVTFTDGDSQGIGMIETGLELSQRNFGGSTSARQKFTVTRGTRTVKNLKVRLLRTTSSAANLNIELRGDTEGVMTSTSIAGSNVPQTGTAYITWTFSSSQTLVLGRTYYVTLSSASQHYKMNPDRGGDISYGFENNTTWKDGVAEFYNGSSWATWDRQGTPVADFDLQMYFELDEAMVESSISATPSSVSPGGSVTVSVEDGPGGTLDWVGKYLVGSANSAFLSDWQYLNGTQTPPSSGSTSASLSFTMPVTPGDYEFRFFRNDSNLEADRLATSNTVTVTPDSTHPTDPTSLVATAITSSRIDLSWSASTDLQSGIANYEVYRCEGGACTPTTLIASPPDAVYSDTTGLSENTTYSYRVRAENGEGLFSGYSNTEIEATPLEPDQVAFPDPPTSPSSSASAPTFPGSPTSPSSSASAPTFPGSPTSPSSSASAPTFPGAPTLP